MTYAGLILLWFGGFLFGFGLCGLLYTWGIK